jgi:hypothetical protein
VYIVDRNTAETLLSLEHGARRFDDAERWLAVESDEILEIYDLRVASDPAYKKPLVGLDHVRLTKFHAGGRLVSVTGSVSGEVTGDALIPLDLELTKRFAKWLARPRALSKAEACAYLPERHDRDYVPVLPNSKPSGKGQAGASANK